MVVQGLSLDPSCKAESRGMSTLIVELERCSSFLARGKFRILDLANDKRLDPRSRI